MTSPAAGQLHRLRVPRGLRPRAEDGDGLLGAGREADFRSARRPGGGDRDGRGARRGPNLHDRRHQHRRRQIQTLPSGRNYTVDRTDRAGRHDPDLQHRGLHQHHQRLRLAGLENSYVIDGVNTTGVEYGAQGKELNYEFIQEIDIKTGGYEAEYGRSTGGIINVITKSGGNDFHGDAFGYYDRDWLQADNAHPNESALGTSPGYTREDFGADLGGYIVKDRLWFFGAYDRVQNKTTRS